MEGALNMSSDRLLDDDDHNNFAGKIRPPYVATHDNMFNERVREDMEGTCSGCI